MMLIIKNDYSDADEKTEAFLSYKASLSRMQTQSEIIHQHFCFPKSIQCDNISTQLQPGLLGQRTPLCH